MLFSEFVMMVTKLWNSCFPELIAPQIHRHSFYLCQWQRSTQVKIIYLLYRWLAAILFLAALVCSLLDVGRPEPTYEFHHIKWWIYLTHWGLLACTLQAWLGAWIVTQGTMVDRDDFEFQRQAKTSIIHRAYWVLYSIATVYSFIITICYWTVVHDPDKMRIDSVNLMVHVLNSILMFIDLTIVGHPFKLNHSYWTMGLGFVYAVFSAIYYFAGGTDRRQSKAIYPLLDWSKPGKSIVVTACGILFVFLIHLFVYCLYRVRVCLFTKLCMRKTSSKEKITSIGRTLSSLEDGQKENFLNPTAIVDLKL